MAETKRNYEIGYGKPPVGRRFEKGQSGNPAGGAVKKTAAPLLVRRIDEQVVVASSGQRQKTTRREVVIVQLVDQPAAAALSATKILTGLLKEVEKEAGPSSRPVEIV